MSKSAEIVHRTNVTTTELTDHPEERSSKTWAERRGQAADEQSQQPNT